MAKVIVITTIKGGIAKTTTATVMASLFMKKGFRTLLIDTDPQGNSTDTYHAVSEGETTLYDVLLESDRNRVPVSKAIQHTKQGDIVPADKYLVEADEKLNGKLDGFTRLRTALTEVQDDYDYIVIDTACAMNMLLYNTLVATDDIIIPITADRFAIQGLNFVYQEIQAVQKNYNPNLRIAGLLLVKNNPRTNLSRDLHESIEAAAKQMGTRLFPTFIRNCNKVNEAQSVREFLINYAPKATATEDYINFMEEYLED